jgi:hypothetical protein
MSAIEEVCPVCKNTNGEHLPRCERSTPKEWNDKRTGRPPFGDGYERRAIGIRCTPAEFAAILDGLTSRGRTEAMLATIRDDTPAQGKE